MIGTTLAYYEITGKLGHCGTSGATIEWVRSCKSAAMLPERGASDHGRSSRAKAVQTLPRTSRASETPSSSVAKLEPKAREGVHAPGATEPSRIRNAHSTDASAVKA